jgi:hypothetical protein
MSQVKQARLKNVGLSGIWDNWVNHGAAYMGKNGRLGWLGAKERIAPRTAVTWLHATVVSGMDFP